MDVSHVSKRAIPFSLTYPLSMRSIRAIDVSYVMLSRYNVAIQPKAVCKFHSSRFLAPAKGLSHVTAAQARTAPKSASTANASNKAVLET